MLTSRRNFLGLLAAPAIVRASSLMRVVPLPELPVFGQMTFGHGVTWTATRFVRLPLPYAPLSEGIPHTSQLLRLE